MFFWNSLAFSMIQTDVGNLISGSSAFSKSSLNIWKFTVHILWSLAWRILSITYRNNGDKIPFSLLLANFHILTIWMKVKMLVPQSWLTLCDLMDCSWPGFSDHGILQARMLGWSGLPFPSPGDLPDPGVEPGSVALQAYFLPSEPSGKPYYLDICL